MLFQLYRYRIMKVTLTTALLVGLIFGVTAESPEIYHGFEYYFKSTKLAYAAAQADCRHMGAELLYLYTAPEAAWVKAHALLQAQKDSSIGYFYSAAYNVPKNSLQASYTWDLNIGQKPMNFTDWYSTEGKVANEQCSLLHKSYSFRWSDVVCTHPSPYICKKEIPPVPCSGRSTVFGRSSALGLLVTLLVAWSI